jgi:Domain of unknown function (DUF397)
VSLPDQMVSDYPWRKARRSANDGACVEVALVNGQIAVRDSKNPAGCWLRYPVRSWRDFTSNLETQAYSSTQTLAR